MGVSSKWVKSKRRKRKEKTKVGDNNGQATHGARMAHAWRTQAAWANIYTGSPVEVPPELKKIKSTDQNLSIKSYVT